MVSAGDGEGGVGSCTPAFLPVERVDTNALRCTQKLHAARRPPQCGSRPRSITYTPSRVSKRPGYTAARGVTGLTAAELTAALNSLGPLAWLKLSDDQVCFTIIPEQGTQVWA
jgi:hypothetical protein